MATRTHQQVLYVCPVTRYAKVAVQVAYMFSMLLRWTPYQAPFTRTRFQIYTVTWFRNRVQQYTCTDTKRLHENDFSVFGAVTSWSKKSDKKKTDSVRWDLDTIILWSAVIFIQHRETWKDQKRHVSWNNEATPQNKVVPVKATAAITILSQAFFAPKQSFSHLHGYPVYTAARNLKNTFIQEKLKPRLTFKPRLALIGFRTIGPRV